MEDFIARRNQMLTDILNGGEVDTVAQHIKELASVMLVEPPAAFPTPSRDGEDGRFLVNLSGLTIASARYWRNAPKAPGTRLVSGSNTVLPLGGDFPTQAEMVGNKMRAARLQGLAAIPIEAIGSRIKSHLLLLLIGRPPRPGAAERASQPRVAAPRSPLNSGGITVLPCLRHPPHHLFLHLYLLPHSSAFLQRLRQQLLTRFPLAGRAAPAALRPDLPPLCPDRVTDRRRLRINHLPRLTAVLACQNCL